MSARLRVLHTTPTTRADYGGPSRSVPFMCEAAVAAGASVQLVTTSPPEGQEAIWPAKPVEIRTVPEPRTVRTGLQHLHGFYHSVSQGPAKGADLVYDSGLWLPMHLAVAAGAWKAGTPLVVTPRGMLMPWALKHKRFKKQVTWWAYQRWVLRSAAMLHVTAPAEAEAIRSVGLEQPIAVVPNGVAIPETMPEAAKADGYRNALFLSRIHPKKGLTMLLEAWAAERPSGWHLTIAGPDEGGHTADLKRQCQLLGLQEVVSFPGLIPEKEKWKLYAVADLFVLPTHSENFGIVVPEALAAGVPVLTTTGAPWRELQTHTCGWWVKPTTSAIRMALRDALSRTDRERMAMGERGRQLVREKYTWGAVGEQIVAAFQWLLGRSARPSCVQLDE